MEWHQWLHTMHKNAMEIQNAMEKMWRLRFTKIRSGDSFLRCGGGRIRKNKEWSQWVGKEWSQWVGKEWSQWVGKEWSQWVGKEWSQWVGKEWSQWVGKEWSQWMGKEWSQWVDKEWSQWVGKEQGCPYLSYPGSSSTRRGEGGSLSPPSRASNWGTPLPSPYSTLMQNDARVVSGFNKRKSLALHEQCTYRKQLIRSLLFPIEMICLSRLGTIWWDRLWLSSAAGRRPASSNNTLSLPARCRRGPAGSYI